MTGSWRRCYTGGGGGGEDEGETTVVGVSIVEYWPHTRCVYYWSARENFMSSFVVWIRHKTDYRSPVHRPVHGREKNARSEPSRPCTGRCTGDREWKAVGVLFPTALGRTHTHAHTYTHTYTREHTHSPRGHPWPPSPCTADTVHGEGGQGCLPPSAPAFLPRPHHLDNDASRWLARAKETPLAPHPPPP